MTCPVTSLSELQHWDRGPWDRFVDLSVAISVLTRVSVQPYCALCTSASIILHGLPLCGRVAVIPKRFHFVIIPLVTVDCRIFRSKEISWLDLHRRHPITVPRWNSLSSWEQHILSQMFVETVCMPRCLLLHTCGHGSDWNTWFQLFGWVTEYFWQYSVFCI